MPSSLLKRVRAGLVRTYFRTVRVHGQDRLPGSGTVLYACVHRNGAVDGLVMETVLDDALGVAGKNLTRSALLRLLLGEHVAIHRHPATPAENRENLRQLKKVAALAVGGKPVAMFPEGTSKLGPNLLPVRKGMAYLARLAVKEGRGEPVRIVPVGLHYERGFAFRSAVEVTFGAPLTVTEADVRDLDALTERITEAMGTVAVSFRDAEEQRRGELFADLATALDPGASHRRACLDYASGQVPEAVREAFDAAVAGRDRHGSPPVLPHGGLVLGTLEFLFLTPIILAALAANLLPVLGGVIAARIMADDDNVITLWRLLAGLPLWCVQGLGYCLWAAFHPAWALPMAAGYVASSLIGAAVYWRWKRAFAGLRNLFGGRGKELRRCAALVKELHRCGR
jgi:1-acyl-sn-glycerol-3-phosphate acyltransferase